MSRCSKLLTKARRSPKNFAFNNIGKLAECYGFVLDRQSGSHMIYEHPAYPDVRMNFQKGRSGNAKPYQIRQLLAFIDELSDSDEEGGVSIIPSDPRAPRGPT